jgi:hypothetical protein
MVFKGTDGPFCCIPAMNVWWGELYINVIGGHEWKDGIGSFIIQSLQSWLEAAGSKQLMSSLVGCHDAGSRSRLKGLNMNEVGVIVIDNHEVRVAGRGHSGKARSLVGVDLASGRLNGDNDLMGPGLNGGWRTIAVG